MILTKIIDDTLIIEMTDWDIIWSLKKRVDIPLAHITNVQLVDRAHFPGFVLRVPGTAIPGIITAGSYTGQGKWYFWNVRSGRNAIVIDTREEHYSQIVLELRNPERLIEELNSKIGRGAVAV